MFRVGAMPNDALTKLPLAPVAERPANDGKADRRAERPRPLATPIEPTVPNGERRRPKGTRRLVAVAVGVAILIGSGSYWWLNRGLVSTDDAFIDGNAVVLSPQVGGKILRLLIDDNQKVETGDLLLEIDPSDYEAALESARADLDSALASEAQAAADLAVTKATTAAAVAEAQSGVELAQANLGQAQAQLVASTAEDERAATDAQRYASLAKNDYASRQTLDQAQATARKSAAQKLADSQAVAVARARIGQASAQLAEARAAEQQVAVKEAVLKTAAARVAAARAAVRTAELNLSYTRIVASEDGYVTRRQVNVGDVVKENQTLATLVVGHPWVTANFKETQLTHMRPGQPVRIQVDAYPDVTFTGHVDSVMRGTGARFSLLPPENATGNYVKVVQRVPVKIVFDKAPDPGYALALGMSVVPTVDARAGAPSAR